MSHFDEFLQWRKRIGVNDTSDILPASEIQRVIEQEPELPGTMPDEMWECIRNDRDAAEELMRIVARETKENIIAALKKGLP